jgi:hypothetical protein
MPIIFPIVYSFIFVVPDLNSCSGINKTCAKAYFHAIRDTMSFLAKAESFSIRTIGSRCQVAMRFWLVFKERVQKRCSVVAPTRRVSMKPQLPIQEKNLCYNISLPRQ